jgi:hypothetical protein
MKRFFTLLTTLPILILFAGSALPPDTQRTKFPLVNDTLPRAEKPFLADTIQLSWTNLETVSTLDSGRVFTTNKITPEKLYKFGIQKAVGTRVLKLYVDTTQTIAIESREEVDRTTTPNNDNSFGVSVIISAKVVYKKAYPVFIINETNSKQLLELEDGQVMMIQEAKNENGDWLPIEAWMYSDCGNSYYSLVLEPRQYGFTRIKQYYGDFVTELRVKMQNGDSFIYSNTFKGRINKSQMANPEDVAKIRANELFNWRW